MKRKISIIGGDLRIVNLARLLANDGFEVYAYGMENASFLTEVTMLESLEETIEKSNIIVSGVPLSQDGININLPYSEKKISIMELKKMLKDKIFIAGKIPDEIKSDNTIEFYDLLQIEEYAILNAIATAEGAIQIAMEEYPKTLSGSNILIMGFGRIGKILAKMLQGIGANVFCEARKNADLAYIKAYGYNAVNLIDLDENLSQYDIIINNIPTMILDKDKLNKVKKDALIIDLASKPGGVDFEYAKQKKINTIWALALPGKVAPISAAEYIRDIIYNII